MDQKFVEENGIYQIDCSKAVWATDQIHEIYHSAGVQLKDSDFLIECISNFNDLSEHKEKFKKGEKKP